MEPMAPTPEPDRAVYVISVAAELAGVHAQTLRIYERKGLVEPARTPWRESQVQRNRHSSPPSDPGANQRGTEFSWSETCS